MSISGSRRVFPLLAVLLCLLVLSFGSAYYYFEYLGPTAYGTALVQKTTVEDVVSFTGNVAPKKRVSLGFEKSGRVVFLPFTVGQYVSPNQILAVLSTGETEAILNQARADVRAQSSVLRELQNGTRKESIAVATTRVQSATEERGRVSDVLVQTLTDAFTKSDDAVRTTLDPLFTDDNSNDPKLTFAIPDDQLKTKLKNERIAANNTLLHWKALNTLGYHLSDGYILDDVTTATDYLDSIGAFLDDAAQALSLLSSASAADQTALVSLKAAITTARASISASQVGVASARGKFTEADSAVSLATQELKLLQAGSTAETVAAQQARLDAASAKLPQYQNELEKNYLRSPIAGVVASQDIEEGEVVLPQEPIISIISTSTLEVKATISELDVAKVKVGDPARVTLDAYGPTISWDAVVTRVDPAETMIDNSPTYGIRLEFVKPDLRLTSGMTANVTLVAAKRQNVLAIPARALRTENSAGVVSVVTSFRTEEKRRVMPGLVGSNGMVEILNGLSEGERVVVSGD